MISTKPNPPWISDDIVRSIRKRSRLYIRAKRSINPDLMEKYKLLRNRIVRGRKRDFFASFCSECFNHVEVGSKYLIPELAELPAEFLCSEEFVFTYIARLRANIACGPDLITARMLKLFANFIIYIYMFVATYASMCCIRS